VPIFLKQIEAGGPVTITDQEMTRYFMTIPEAVQLVMQAVTLASQGTIYMLDMGDPVRITDLACRLIEMSGLRPHTDIEVRVVGTRPGEKLHEQLWYEDTPVSSTDFSRVLAVHAHAVPAGFEGAIRALEQAALSRRDEEVLQLLRQMPIEFNTAKSAVMIA
jgi:FlaA1/EpsC-like NDP-sugar epimerase